MEARIPASVVPATRTFPVSVKGIAVQSGKVLLLENERAEWELPGGKLELGKTARMCRQGDQRGDRLAGHDETAAGNTTSARAAMSWWSPTAVTSRAPTPPVVSREHKRAGLFAAGDVPHLTMPDGYNARSRHSSLG